MAHAVSEQLLEKGSTELEGLLRVAVYRSSQVIFIVDDERRCTDVSLGAYRLTGLSRDELIVRQFDDLLEPDFAPRMQQLWSDFLEQGEQEGVLPLVTSGATAQEVSYLARAGVLPNRHMIVSRERTDPKQTPPRALDYALYLLDAKGRIASWNRGAERVYGYSCDEAVGCDLSVLDPGFEASSQGSRGESVDAYLAGRTASQGWRRRKDGSRFWSVTLSTSIRGADAELLGHARVVRDFSEPYGAITKTKVGKLRPVQPTVVGVVAGEFDRVTEASEAFLDMVGYSLEELLSGQPYWPDLSPAEYSGVDELAHEETLIHGASTPFEKQLIRKDGSRMDALVTVGVLNISPFRWITFVQDLSPLDAEADEDDAPVTERFDAIVGESRSIQRVLGQIELVAPTDATVLILGETGTGKELVARAIHRLSIRSGPFVTLNCAAIPTGLLESELFGYEKGAFTGALARKIGRFEMADKGTLFLDEVGDIPLELQPKLLRALQEKEFERLGGSRTIPINVRLVAATNRDLPQMMDDKLFRSDLYYRLRVFPIQVPSLREHPEDIPALARHFMAKYAPQMKRNVETIPTATMEAMKAWPWPGNVRELENFVERSVILSRGPELRAPLGEIRKSPAAAGAGGTMSEIEREHVIRTLRESGGVVTKAAKRLDMPRTTLNAMMRKLGITRKDF